MIHSPTFRNVRLHADNPVLNQELKRIPWSQKRSGVRRYFGIVVGIILLATAGIWCLNAIGFCQQLYTKSCDLFLAAEHGFSTVFFAAMIIFSTFVGLFLDIYYINLPARRLLREKESGSWDILRTTALPGSKIIAAKYAVAQLRAWRVLAIEVALRFTIAT